MSNLEDVLSKLVYSNVSQTGAGGGTPSRWAIFVSFWKKKLFKSHWITFRTCSKPFQKTRFLTFESQSKNFTCSFLLLAIKVQNLTLCCKILIVSDLVHVRHIAFCNILAVNNNPLENFS